MFPKNIHVTRKRAKLVRNVYCHLLQLSHVVADCGRRRVSSCRVLCCQVEQWGLVFMAAVDK